MKNLNQKHTVPNTFFSAVTEKGIEQLSIRQPQEEPSNLKVVFQLTALMLALPIITAAFLLIIKLV